MLEAAGRARGRKRATVRGLRRRLAIAFALALGWPASAQTAAVPDAAQPGRARPLLDVAGIEGFASRFDESAGTPRLVLLLSPT